MEYRIADKPQFAAAAYNVIENEAAASWLRLHFLCRNHVTPSKTFNRSVTLKQDGYMEQILLYIHKKCYNYLLKEE